MRKILSSFLIYALIVIFNSSINAQIQIKPETIYVASWNVENLFDDLDDPKTNDKDFLPEGSKNWTIDKLETKIEHLGYVINYMNNGCGPDIIGFMEVENITVLKPLAYKFKDRDYIIAHRDSPDERGIDNALFYDRNKFMIDRLEVIPVDLGNRDKTRDILHVSLTVKSTGEILHLFVNHWPSRVGGTEKSEAKRMKAAGVLKSAVAKLQSINPDASVIIMGDLNDEPSDISVKDTLNARPFNCKSGNYGKGGLFNLSYEEFENGMGTLMYRNDWEMFDQIIINGNLYDGKGIDFICGSFNVVKPPFMISKNEKDHGAPIPTFKGRNYTKGYSDHFPVCAEFIVKKD